MINLLPAVLIGGPSQIDRSVLFYGLTKALYERSVAHHALRVYSHEEETRFPAHKQAHVRLLSVDTPRDGAFIDRLGQDLAQRLLPTLIDVSIEQIDLQSCILQQCTHFILLLSEDDQENKASWLQIGERYGLLPVAYVYSPLKEAFVSKTCTPRHCSNLFDFRKRQPEIGTFFDCLVERLANLFDTYSPAELLRLHLHYAPGELPLNLSTLLHTVAPALKTWKPHILNALLDSIPVHVSLSVYGQAPQWLYAALAAHTHADEFYQLAPSLLPDERNSGLPGGISSGWVASPLLLLSTTTSSNIHVTYAQGDESCRITVEITAPALDYLQATSLPFPPVPSHLGLILAGSMPTWLLTALIRLYVRAGVAWIACDQGQQRAIVIFSQTSRYTVGEVIFTF